MQSPKWHVENIHSIDPSARNLLMKRKNHMAKIKTYTIKPETAVSRPMNIPLGMFPLKNVSPVVGMSASFIARVIGKKSLLDSDDIARLVDQDAFSETFVPRSKIHEYLIRLNASSHKEKKIISPDVICKGDAKELIDRLADSSIQCTVTSTPYWAMRVYDGMRSTEWADGEICPFGLEQTPEGFVRHSVEILYGLMPKMKSSGSVWWNIMDTFNTRTQIRSNAVEALHAMQGKDKRSWKDYKYKRYSCGHSFLKDGEQCLIPYRIAERASRMGYFVKSIISWCKTSSLPEPQNSRVSRNVEYILHLTKSRSPMFIKQRYVDGLPEIGGRQQDESRKLSDFWYLPTSSGRNGHGAQFPLQLPGRCILLSSNEGDTILDPFAGAGTTLLAAQKLKRRFIGFDISENYVNLSRLKLNDKEA